LPVPEHAVDPDAIEEAREHLVRHERMLAEVDTEVRKAEGALQQVGGEVVRDKANAARDALDAARREAAELELDYEAWKLLVEVLREAENDEGRHLGEALGGSIGERFGSLTAGRYGRLELGPDLQTQGLRAAGDVRPVETLSEGLKEQLATLLRVAIAEQLCTMLVLDDHLTQTDPARIDWFRDLLREAARTIQIVVLTCRPTDYLQPEELTRDSSDPRSSVCVVDLTAVIRRAEPSGANERV
jgi:uncharacterized protein YhaN